METTTTETDFITREDELVLIRKAQAGDLSARDELLEAHSGWIHKCARRHWYPRRYRMEYDDCFQLAVLGAMRAIEKFDCEKGFSFMTYSEWWMRAKIGGSADSDSVIRSGRAWQNRKASGRNKEQAHRARSVSSLDVPVGDGDAPLVTLVEATDDTVREVEKLEAAATVEDAMRCLSARDKDVMRLKLSGMTQVEIGERLGVTRERIRQIEGRATAKMATYLYRKRDEFRERKPVSKERPIEPAPSLPGTFVEPEPGTTIIMPAAPTLVCEKCGSDRLRKHGATRRGAQRYSCDDCGVTFAPNRYIRKIGDCRSPRFEAVCELIRDGKGNREIARLTGAAKHTVARYREIIEAESGPVLCPCGLPATHNGWCKHRYQQSHTRQQTMDEMHRKQRTQQDNEVEPMTDNKLSAAELIRQQIAELKSKSAKMLDHMVETQIEIDICDGTVAELEKVAALLEA